MKKIVFLSLFAWCLPGMLSAQRLDDDLYYVPSKKSERVEKKPASATDAGAGTSVRTVANPSSSHTTIIVKDRKGNVRDVDEYNRRYDSKEYDFSQENDTLYIDEKEYNGMDGEWVNGFDGSEDDYEYATRIIRFRNPRYAISVSSPLYWEVVYGLNSWDWNVYADGLYAYAFPTFTNRLWWDWRYSSYGWGGYPYCGWGWSSWYGPSWGWSFGWNGWYGGWWGHHHHYHPGYYDGGYWGGGYRSRDTYTNRRSLGTSAYRNSSSTGRQAGVPSYRRSTQNRATTTRRVVGTRSSGTRAGVTTRTDASSARRSTYTRPSSTRVNSSVSAGETHGNVNAAGARRSAGRSTSTYSRGSSTTPTRNYSSGSGNRRSYTPAQGNSSSSSRSYSSGRSGGSRSYSGGGSSRSSGGSRRR